MSVTASSASSIKAPMDDRSCTDILCCALFSVFVLGMLMCAIVGFVHGEPKRIYYPTDSQGNICGDGKFVKKPYLMFFDLLQCGRMDNRAETKGCPTPQVCVEKCTSSSYTFLETIILEKKAGHMLVKEREKMLCKYDVNPVNKSLSVEKLVRDEDCAPYYVKTSPGVKPTVFITQAVQKKYAAFRKATRLLAKFYAFFRFVVGVYNDLVRCWQVFLVGVLMTMVFSLIWILLMRCFVGFLVWFTMFGLGIILVLATVYAFVKYRTLKNAKIDPNSLSYDSDSEKYAWLTIGIIGLISLVLLGLLVCCCCSRIQMAITLIKEGGRAITYMVTILFWPLIPFILELLFCAFWLSSFIYVITMLEAEYMKTTYTNISTSSNTSEYTNISTIKSDIKTQLNRIPCSPDLDQALKSKCEFVKYGQSGSTTFIKVYMIFMLLWVMNFIIALGQMVLAGSFASYYWAFKKPKDIPALPVLKSFQRTVRYHLGSLAFGSLLITIIQAIRIILEYLDQTLKDNENMVARFVVKCLKCCFYCFEKFLQYFNKNAYIMIAAHGKNFCQSGKDAFSLITSNILRTVIMDRTAHAILFLGKVFITGLVITLITTWFQGDLNILQDSVPEVNHYIVPVIFLAIISYWTSCAFFSVYSMGMMTIYLCFLEDLKENDGSKEKPYYMTKQLLDVMGKQNEDSRI